MKFNKILLQWYMYPIYLFVLGFILNIFNALPSGGSILIIMFILLFAPPYYLFGLGWWLGRKKSLLLAWILGVVFVIIGLFIGLFIFGSGSGDYGRIIS